MKIPFAASLVVLTACQSTGPDPWGMTESERLDLFFEEVFEERLARSPMRQTALGLEEGRDRWDDLTDAYARAGNDQTRRNLERLRSEFDFELLDGQARLSYRLFEYRAGRELAGFRWRFHDYPVNQMRGPHSNVPAFLINMHRIDDVSDAEAYIARLERVDEMFAQLTDNLVIRERMGILPPRFVFAKVLDAARNVISGEPFDGSGEDGTLLADFRAKVAKLDLPDEREGELLERGRAALLGSVRPAYERLITTLDAQQRVASTDDGAWKLPNGAELYEHALSRATTTGMSAVEIHELGLSEVERLHGEMKAIMRQVDFDGSLREFFAFMRDEPRFYYSNDAAGRAAYLAEATRIVEAMRARLDELFISVPRAPMIVKAVEPYRERSAGKAFYQRGSPDGSRPGVYYANLYDTREMPIYQMEALAYHEGIPGHHMQNTIAQELEDLPRFRKFGGYTAYGEGWGLYTELIPKEMGFYADPYSDFGRLAMELWRACRLVVDTGIHDKRWTREYAIQYLKENTPNPEGDCIKAIERYIVMPGQATAYKIGMIEILALRELARERLGERFDVREFHETILTCGPLPLDLLGEVVEEWIDSALEG